MGSGVACAAMVVGIIALLVFVVGFGAPYWIWVDTNDLDSHSGLWMDCNSQDGAILCVQTVTEKSTEDWMRGAQGCEVLGFLLGLGGVIMAAIWICKPRTVALMWITFIFFLLAAIFGAIGIGIFAAKVPKSENLHFAFYLTICGCVLYLFTGILAVIGACSE
ncbi:hypothetical protein CAPTEDRAFT_195691 [Capitella teleta]|uniref:Uncharacterized protein n=1 Tax=Capitella teleta TaxID=283909 RepID=X1ZVE1_CAPTE|nr:hypothetical protein CAPTEDRAFT_195691 [Capitella teleta]|eukprot:ELT88404.1 hypothetical protein CAPTEDRAFT_195691 [Capitella teleta]